MYGKLYNQYAVLDPRGLAPEGWRIPSNADWNTLRNHVNNNAAALKDSSKMYWYQNTPATNTSGFTALPGGIFGGGPVARFEKIRVTGNWWAADLSSHWSMHIESISFNQGSIGDHVGLSVRCIRNL